ALAARYVELLEAPYAGETYLCGWSAGGLLAFEVAKQLEKRGRSVAGLVLLDTFVLTGLEDAAGGDPAAFGGVVRGGMGVDLGPREHTVDELATTLGIGVAELRERMRVYGSLSAGAQKYSPTDPLCTPVYFISPEPEQALRTWGDVLRRATSITIQSNHYSMM